MRLVAAGAHEDVALAAEQRGRARFVAQPRRIAAEFRAAEFHPLARIGQSGGEAVGCGARAGFVGAAEEENCMALDPGGQAAGEIAVLELHRAASARPRSASETCVAICSASSSERFSSAFCSAAMVAYSEDVASSRIPPVERSTSW